MVLAQSSPTKGDYTAVRGLSRSLSSAPLIAILGALALLAISAVLASSAHAEHRRSLDPRLENLAASESSVLDDYFDRARAIDLITAQNPGFLDF